MPDIRLNSILTPPVTHGLPAAASQKTDKDGKSFDELFSSALCDTDELKFSKHALSRLESRNIRLGEPELQKLESAVSRASSKGVQDSLVLLSGLAFIVNVPDRTVVTAMPVNEASSNVFTNIDGAVII